MGKPGRAIESGCCRSTGRVQLEVMKQSEQESANEALVIQAEGRQFGPQNLNQMKHCNATSYEISHTIWCGEHTICGSKCTI
jgi:hypothetical protein